jgi:ribonuclease P protein component
MTANQSYGKKEKLKSRKELDALFNGGKSFLVFPVKVFYANTDATTPAIKTGVGVSSRYFKKATDRNRVKRLLRETYRTEKAPLLEVVAQGNIVLNVFLLYVDKTLPEYSNLKKVMANIIQKLIQHAATQKNP